MIPKGPGSALRGANRIDHTAFGDGIQENAITIRVFDEAFSITDVPNKTVFEAIQIGFREMFRDISDFLIIDPNVSRLRTTATVPAARAFKRQPTSVPRSGVIIGDIVVVALRHRCSAQAGERTDQGGELELAKRLK